MAESDRAEFDVRGRRAVVVGGADSGVAAAHLLRARGAEVTLTDLSPTVRDEARLRDAGVSLVLGDHPATIFTGVDLVVVSPGVPLGQAALTTARQAGVPIIGEIELASRWLRGRVIAITGTKGKSTTTTLVGRILSQAGIRTEVGGNLGPPLSAQVADSTPETVHVVEVSSFQLETTARFHPWIAVLLNFSRGPSRPARQSGRIRGGQDSGLRQPDGRGLGGRERGRPERAGDGEGHARRGAACSAFGRRLPRA